MSDCVLFPASLSKNRAWSVWADRESCLSLAEGICTLISPRVQPCGWKRYVRTFTVIHASTNRTLSFNVGVKRLKILFAVALAQ
ncbi:hypothetical protein [Microcoleus sp. BROC3]|uniref:hypothetical protein n=1 Tax=Microcoleus sp. BROC3 TaxID=3055323 RepID=UPI002FD0C14D